MRVLFIVFTLSSALAFAAPPNTLITDIPGRATVSLNGSWPAIVDPIEAGLGNKFYLDAKPKDKSDRVEYNFDLTAAQRSRRLEHAK